MSDSELSTTLVRREVRRVLWRRSERRALMGTALALGTVSGITIAVAFSHPTKGHIGAAIFSSLWSLIAGSWLASDLD